MFLLTREKARQLKTAPEDLPQEPEPTSGPDSEPSPEPLQTKTGPTTGSENLKTTFRLSGTVPSEVWNLLGRRLLPKLRSGDDLTVGIDFSVSVGPQFAQNMEAELRQILEDLELGDRVRVERG